MSICSRIVAVAAVTLAHSPVCADDAAESFRQLRAQSNAAIARHDSAEIGSFLAPDYVVSISSGVIERSRDAHVASFAQHFVDYPDVVYVRTPASIRISGAYALAIEHGTWTGTRTTRNGRLENGGDYTAAWKLTESGWKIYSEIFVGLYCNGTDC
jgi:ketosteroid isomerase-like protein